MVHILVVDDDKNTRRLYKAVLESENYTVYTAENGEKALGLMDREHIDLVVLDVMMPKMDGYEFTKVLRESQNTLPILMVSAKHLPEDKKKEYLDIIEEEALRLSAMATNVMNMTKVENQTILTDITKFNLSEQIRSSVLLLENAWTKERITRFLLRMKDRRYRRKVRRRYLTNFIRLMNHILPKETGSGLRS